MPDKCIQFGIDRAAVFGRPSGTQAQVSRTRRLPYLLSVLSQPPPVRRPFVLVGWGSWRFARMEEGCIEKASGRVH